ncbi:MAG TPA: YqeG family HAD IIIA-type phosphatase [Firmicutes bacterium]|jgi:HAD superfamily phosphatase (TIGR01668 family)|nr:YqeG family HAD IIIA-type phosphatase [Bacillota bacterium]
MRFSSPLFFGCPAEFLGGSALLKVFCPNEMTGSLLDIDLNALAAQGIKALIIDLDNTLMGWDAEQITSQIKKWVQMVKAKGFRICIASNGLSNRVKRIAAELDVPAVPKAIKPRKRPFRLALRLLNTRSDQTAVIGDQVFTDILGGNRMNCYTILINPISRKELRSTRFMRRVERRILRRLHKKGLVQDKSYRQRLGIYKRD